MLIISRRVDEQFRVGDDVKIKILSIKGGQVRIGVTAPDDVGVHREEIYQRILNNESRSFDTQSEFAHHT